MNSINSKSKSFMLYKEWEEIFLALESDAERGELIREIFAFVRTGEDPDLKGAMKIAFMVMSNQLRRDSERYKKVCERNQKNIAKRWDNEDDTKKYDRIPTDTKNTDKEKDEEKDKDEDKEEDEGKELTAKQDHPEVSHSPAHKKHKFGEFKNISLSLEEYGSLVKRFGKHMTDKCIESMDAYMEQSGKVYQSCYAKLKNWISEDIARSGNINPSKASWADSGKITDEELAEYETYARAHAMEDFARELEQKSTIHQSTERQ
ncbi:DUF6291 domain-containing protein [Ruminococcus albus]|uniref:DUF6291 domain-containing protein n=1 Tax=Ruminococcus albus TaxID=1264 RepID=A0A1H7FNJ0_RUMAL|nr:DUF6291 domain-containing protein [Ruminococcus albus]SEK27521.1 hypothetical protein SAMN05216469_101341 [Ruminococcus albus]